MHRIETEHVRVVCESQQVEFVPIVICFSCEEKMSRLVNRLHHNPCWRWIHRRMLLSICCVLEPIVCRCSYNLKYNVKSYHIILGYGRGAMTRTLMGWYWSRWYILECYGAFYPAQNTQSSETMWNAKGLKQPWYHLPPCRRRLLYDHALWHVPDLEGSWMVAWLKCCDVTWLLESSLKVCTAHYWLTHTTLIYFVSNRCN